MTAPDRQPMQLVDGGHAYRTITYIDAVDAPEAILDAGEVEEPDLQRRQQGRRDPDVGFAELMRKTYAEITGDASPPAPDRGDQQPEVLRRGLRGRDRRAERREG
jgi:hypothetical protein